MACMHGLVVRILYSVLSNYIRENADEVCSSFLSQVNKFKLTATQMPVL